ncbi:hypothetical protein NA57DRAFT_73875 [Rhizodiscina lignyota]|uniref:Uncharacterized protein n=1 Tax=Rhizodiscina lignyota TaxID=1504668 RepID=A0A9P4IJ53_9PEZI|nr:hypothetical protein NA57DRAFT_73875 [Rhizodiscina lignyota]
MKLLFPSLSTILLLASTTHLTHASEWSVTFYDDQSCQGNVVLQDSGDENKECVPSFGPAYSYRFTQDESDFLFYPYQEQECGGGAIVSGADCPFSVNGFFSYGVGEVP